MYTGQRNKKRMLNFGSEYICKAPALQKQGWEYNVKPLYLMLRKCATRFNIQEYVFCPHSAG